jgi:capsular polysaccharide transport system permease protein
VSTAPANGFIGWLKRIDRMFLFTVVLPTMLAIVYYGLIASDRYVSESRFLVRSAKGQTTSSMLGSLLQGGGGGGGSGFSLSGSSSDAYSVHDFILSRDALAELDKTLQVRKAFGQRGLDVFTHFPGLEWWNDNFEALFRYYPSRVSVEFDSTSSVSVLRVNAFTAEDAHRINESLLQMSERLVNQLNDRARRDTIGYATKEVRDAERRAKEAAVMLAAFRTQKGVIDPERQSALHLQAILKLQEELITSKTQLSQLTTYTPNNPQIPSLRTRIEVVQNEIDAEMARVAGGGGGSLANKAAEYERLSLERTFADRQLAGAMAALEAARNEAQRQQLYLERVAQPNQPDASIEPRRMRSILVVLVMGLVAWGILSLLFASVREHLE